MPFTLAEAAQPLFATIGKDATATGDFAPTDVERQALCYVLNQAAQAVVQYAKPTTFAQKQRLRLRPPETVELETDYRGKITSIDVSAASAWTTTHVSSSGGYLQFVFGGDIDANVGDRIKVTGGTSTYEGYHNITAVASNTAGTTCTITTSTASSVSLTANVATVKRALKAWMRGCSVKGATFDYDDTTTVSNRLSRDLTRLLDDDDSNYPLGGSDVTVVHDRALLDENVRGIISDPAKRIIDGTTGAPIWVEKDDEDATPRLFVRWEPLDTGDAIQILQFWTYSSPRAVTAAELNSAHASWNLDFPLQLPAGFFHSYLLPIASQHLVQRLQFSAEEAQSQEGVLAEIYRQYQEAVRRLEEFEAGLQPDTIRLAHV